MAQNGDDKTPGGGSIVELKKKQETLRDMLERARPSMQAVATRYLSADRLIKIALSATSRQPALLECTPASIVRCVQLGAETGLEVGGVGGEAHLVPYRNKLLGGRREAKFIPGYKGLIKLARLSGEVAAIEAHCVYNEDAFSYELGTDPKIMHRPSADRELRHRPTHVYAVCRFKDGTQQFEVMSADQVEAIRKRSPAAESGPWQTDRDQMWRKTAIKRLANYIPQSPYLAAAIEADEESGQPVVLPPLELAAEPKRSGPEALKARLADQRAAEAEQAREDDLPADGEAGADG